MMLESLLELVRGELEKSGVQDPVDVHVAFTVNKKSSGELELDCVDARSRRAEHVHRMKVQVKGRSSQAVSPSVSIPEPRKKPSKAQEPQVEVKRSKTLITPPALPKKRKPW